MSQGQLSEIVFCPTDMLVVGFFSSYLLPSGVCRSICITLSGSEFCEVQFVARGSEVKVLCFGLMMISFACFDCKLQCSAA